MYVPLTDPLTLLSSTNHVVWTMASMNSCSCCSLVLLDNSCILGCKYVRSVRFSSSSFLIIAARIWAIYLPCFANSTAFGIERKRKQKKKTKHFSLYLCRAYSNILGTSVEMCIPTASRFVFYMRNIWIYVCIYIFLITCLVYNELWIAYVLSFLLFFIFWLLQRTTPLPQQQQQQCTTLNTSAHVYYSTTTTTPPPPPPLHTTTLHIKCSICSTTRH